MKYGLRLGVALALLFAVTSCATTEQPPVTDSAYFNIKIQELADDIVFNASRRIVRVAVLDFVNSNGRTSQLGKYFKNKFAETAVKNNLFQVPVEGQVNRAMQDLKLQYNGTLDIESASKLGKALRVDTIVIGVISDLQKGSDIDLVVKMVDTRTGQIISAASASFFRSKQVSSMLETF